MLAPARALNPKFTPDAERYTQAELDSMGALGPQPARGGGAGGRGGRGGGAGRGGNPADIPFPTLRAQFFATEGVAAIIQPGSGNSTMGTVFTGGTGSRDPQNPTRTSTLILAPEHYNRIVRIVDKGTPVRIEANVKNTFYDQDLNAFNVVAEIPGSDPKLKEELVMLGAHFDSWHAGTGATDNAAGSAVMMEALRILKATGLPDEAHGAHRALDWRGAGLVRQPRVRAQHVRHAAPTRPSPRTTSSRATSTSITARARFAASTCRGTQRSARSSPTG